MVNNEPLVWRILKALFLEIMHKYDLSVLESLPFLFYLTETNKSNYIRKKNLQIKKNALNFCYRK